MKVLVLGSGGREHAILWALRQTSTIPLQLYCAPGNAGIAQVAKCLPVSLTDHRSLIDYVKSEAIDLTIVGPEAPLSEGIVDSFEREKLAIVGPTRAASRLESSKAFAKDFMARHKIPTADYALVDSAADARRILNSGRFGSSDSRVVLKADGLAAGKGVIIANSRAEALDAASSLQSGVLIDAKAAKRIVIEEALVGTEASVLLFSDGREFALMPAARDHKRIGENDTGPNTGGMGAVTDRSILDQETLNFIVREIIGPTIEGARNEGFPFRGLLFLGLMLTTDGPKLLEYNVRFGDPETQAILVRLKSSLLDVFDATRSGRLREIKVEWSDDSSACVVLASEGYPGKYATGVPIEGLAEAAADEKVQVFHAGTARSDLGETITAGGRVLGITALGDTLDNALGRCYAAVEKIKWKGMQYRRDIGKFKPQPMKASQ